jgi:hypothetical protein
MKIPNSFKNAIADVFYDKTFSLYERRTVVEADGGTYEQKAYIDDFKGNITNVNSETMRKEYGIDVEGEVLISTHEDLDLRLANFIDGGFLLDETYYLPIAHEKVFFEGYLVGNYHIVKILPYDSHTILVGKLWK